ncbi:hypothetical protein CH63R_01857 [Colletotrichum higginsianum IMI 349063]|uniref:Uncharacterized protein n=1 Tax=Colletotrichum higginsianum (strain IMI 349063) TaxID=759273 RepID=A0A1B7YM60_COLHI|nr:hypothetical protein CH63R_01857 [Colletotrichum higginsianum IMI 349063]OBR13131.1 hypothetical protein CH63R_01857 [Colletotrichum higginsianum IMI 349063]
MTANCVRVGCSITRQSDNPAEDDGKCRPVRSSHLPHLTLPARHCIVIMARRHSMTHRTCFMSRMVVHLR